MSETIGRCEGAVMAACEARGGQIASSPYGERRAIAAAIDRLAADVAEVKAKVDAISPDDVAHLVECERAWVRLVEEKRDAAIRERDQWREEARLAVINRDEARAEVERLTARLGDRAEVQQAQLSAAFTEGTLQAGDAMRARFEQVEKERDDARAEVERLRAIVHSDAGHMAKILIENERLRAAPAAPQPAGQGISPGLLETQPTQNAAPAPGWLTEEERRAVAFAAASFRGHAIAGNLKEMADQLDAILARAGSPPVVDVPPFENYAPEVLHLRYRDAISRAGVKWKEVPRE